MLRISLSNGRYEGIKVIPYSAIAESKRWLLLKKSADGFSVEKSIGEWYIYYNDQIKGVKQ